MPGELDEIESYVEKFVYLSGKYTDPYYDDPYNRPAYVKTGKITDTGILNFGTEHIPHYSFRCETSIAICDCRGRSIGVKVFNVSKGGPIFAIINAAYVVARAGLYEINPCPEGYIDIRTIEQYYMHCCPKALAAAMLEGGYE